MNVFERFGMRVQWRPLAAHLLPICCREDFWYKDLSMTRKPFCADRSRLLAAYVSSVNEWADAVRSLSKEAETTPAKFRGLMAKVDAMRAAASRAKADYAEHRDGHGC